MVALMDSINGKGRAGKRMWNIGTMMESIMLTTSVDGNHCTQRKENLSLKKKTLQEPSRIITLQKNAWVSNIPNGNRVIHHPQYLSASFKCIANYFWKLSSCNHF
jgi:hypothetical protein